MQKENRPGGPGMRYGMPAAHRGLVVWSLGLLRIVCGRIGELDTLSIPQ